MSANLNADNAAEVPAGQWSAVQKKEKPMEEMTLGELLFRLLVEKSMSLTA